MKVFDNVWLVPILPHGTSRCSQLFRLENIYKHPDSNKLLHLLSYRQTQFQPVNDTHLDTLHEVNKLSFDLKFVALKSYKSPPAMLQDQICGIALQRVCYCLHSLLGLYGLYLQDILQLWYDVVFRYYKCVFCNTMNYCSRLSAFFYTTPCWELVEVYC